MKLKKFEIAALILAAVAVCFTAGYFIGRGTGDSEIVIEPNAGASYSFEYIDENENVFSEENAVISGEKININTASIAELEQLPGIGSTLSGRIVDFRENVREFSSIEELTELEGIGTKKFEAIKDLITVG